MFTPPGGNEAKGRFFFLWVFPKPFPKRALAERQCSTPWHAIHIRAPGPSTSNRDEIPLTVAGKFAEDISSASCLPPESATLFGPAEEDA